MSRRLTLPRLGETMEEGRIVRWLKQPGDAFRRGEVLLEVETDKTVVEVPALEDGLLMAHLAGAGDMLPVESPIAELAGEDRPQSATARAPAAAVVNRAPILKTEPRSISGRMRASPAARRIARERGLALTSITGSGRGGRIQGWDLEQPPQPTRARNGQLALRRWPAAGPKLALIHGFGGDSSGFERLARALNGLSVDVVALDLPAHGQTGPITGDMAAILDLVVASLAGEGPLHLAGHSLGGAVAALVADRVKAQSLTLLAPAGLGATIAQGFVDGIASARSPETIGALLGLTTRDALRYTAKVLNALAAHNSDTAVAATRTSIAAALCGNGRQKLDIKPALAALACPTSLILGRHDAIIPTGGFIPDLPRLAQHLLDTGHMPHIEATADVAAIMAARLFPGSVHPR